LLKQLQEFKAGKRDNAIMKGFASTPSDDDMNTSRSTPARAPNRALRRTRIQSSWARRSTAPASPTRLCRRALSHSPNGAGIPAQYPRIGGQHADYAEAQLVAFRGGARANNAEMTAIAAKLSDVEIKAVADYVAGLR
jgi:cytochrome c553